jgi:hypothetical protein
LFHNTWLVHFPQPQFIVFDNGDSGEFKREFKQMCDNYGINSNQLQLTTINPQANAIIEQIHKVVNDMLRSFDLENNHVNIQ